MTKPAGISKLKAKLDKIFSQFIRLRDSTDDGGLGQCCTCDKVIFYKDGDAGHFLSRTYLGTRFDERNVNLQCKSCNGFRAGEQYKHGQYVNMMHGEGVAEELQAIAKQTHKWDRIRYEEQIEKYTKSVKELKASRGLE